MRVPDMSGNDYSNVSAGDGLERPDQQDHLNQSFSHQGLHITTPQSQYSNGYSQSLPPYSGDVQVPMASPTLAQARQPINEAVASAFHTTDSTMSPELIQLITQNVIQQIQAQKLATATVQPLQPVQSATSAPPDPSDNTSSFGGSPIIGRAHVYTPPSPHRPEDHLSKVSSAPLMPKASRSSAHSYEANTRRGISPLSRASDDEAVFSDAEPRIAKPEPLRRVSTDGDATLLEKIWGKFFDDQGKGTAKLDLFLRGVAVHLIEDYEPKYSLVITPKKMQRYYEETRLTEQLEVYPWQHIFDDKTSSISRLLREPEIKVQHHLVQSDLAARPDIPGLTPSGFSAWMTLLIRAHPDQEFERLAKTAREMPINNPDYSKERFPKELSRRLFPERGDDNLATTLAELMSSHCKVQIHARQPSTAGSEAGPPQSSPSLISRRDPPAPTVEDFVEEEDRSDATPVPPPMTNRTSTSTTADSLTSKLRETTSRSSAQAVSSDTAKEDDGSDVPTPRPLERERKPYFGRSDGGKSYDVTGSSGDEALERVRSSTSSDIRRTKSVSNNPARSRPPAPRQRPNIVQPDDRDLSRSRSTTVGADQGDSVYRTRSNSTYAEAQPSRRTRSNSTYASESGGGPRYLHKRSSSHTKDAFEAPRSSAPDMKTQGYQPPNSYPNTYPTGSTPQPNYEYRGQGYDPRDPRDSREPPRMRERERSRERERQSDRDRDRDRDLDQSARATRPRMQSLAAQGMPPGTTQDPHYSGDEYHRQQNPYPGQNGNPAQPVSGQYAQYPPTAYRDSRS